MVKRSAWLLLLASALFASEARAEGPGDGLYDRWEGEITLEATAGGGYLSSPAGDGGALTAGVRARVLDAAGPVLESRIGLSGPDALFFGAELRPLWPGIFLQNLSTGYEWVDLFLASIEVELGAVFLLDGEGSTGFGVGAGLSLPVIYPSHFAHGVWIRLLARRTLASGDQLAASVEPSMRSREAWLFQAALSMQIDVGEDLVTAEPRRYRP